MDKAVKKAQLAKEAKERQQRINKENNAFNSLSLHQSCTIGDGSFQVTKVKGGWLYQGIRKDHGHVVSQSGTTFVPETLYVEGAIYTKEG